MSKDYDYDRRLDSENVIDRQQAEIEALRTALIAANSESNGEYDRLRRQLKIMTESYEGQKRNTIAFMKERDEALAELEHLRGQACVHFTANN